MRIVVADDDPAVRGLLAVHLGLHGHEVIEAADGSEALAAVQQGEPDAVILDVMMPALTGWDVLEQLRTEERFARLPVVICSARDVDDDVRRGYELGANVVVSKPYDVDHLHGILTALVQPRVLPLA